MDDRRDASQLAAEADGERSERVNEPERSALMPCWNSSLPSMLEASISCSVIRRDLPVRRQRTIKKILAPSEEQSNRPIKNASDEPETSSALLDSVRPEVGDCEQGRTLLENDPISSPPSEDSVRARYPRNSLRFAMASQRTPNAHH
jgi:hypothetical protein